MTVWYDGRRYWKKVTKEIISPVDENDTWIFSDIFYFDSQEEDDSKEELEWNKIMKPMVITKT